MLHHGAEYFYPVQPFEIYFVCICRCSAATTHKAWRKRLLRVQSRELSKIKSGRSASSKNGPQELNNVPCLVVLLRKIARSNPGRSDRDRVIVRPNRPDLARREEDRPRPQALRSFDHL